MRRITSALAASCTALLMTSAVAVAQGQIVDTRLTNVTFSAPVSVPGHTLPAGTYHFQLADSQANRNIVQIFDKDNNLVATMLAVPAKRNQPEGDPVITFKETNSSLPPAVHFWYYAGENIGSELVYPKQQAMAIARASGESVMTTDTDSAQANDLKGSKITSVSPNDANTQATQPDTTTAPAEPSTQPATTPVTTAPTTPTTTTEEPTRPTTDTTPQVRTQPQTVGTSGTTTSLPHTASNLPLIGFLGLIALAAGFVVRARRINA